MTDSSAITAYDGLAEVARLEESRARQWSPLTRRERLVEMAVGGTFVAASTALLLLGSHGQPVQWRNLVIAVLALAVVSRVEFEVGSCYTMPLQLVLVPMLFLVPPSLFAPCVAVALLAGKLPEVFMAKRSPGRALLAVGDAFFALGPALVFVVAAPGPPQGDAWPTYLLALAAQFLFDFAGATAREWLNGGLVVCEHAREIWRVHVVDALLAPAGLVVAFAAVVEPWLVLLILPLVGVISLFARERRRHVDHVLELSHAYRGTALVLGNVVEADDAYTGMHSQGVVALAMEVADELRLAAAPRRNVEFGALLHDVGKIAVPKEIINKAGPLDDEEWAIMRQHTIEGQRLLDQVGGFMRDVGRIVRSSHESFDGTGYPDGLAGDQIPLESRIVACCDAFSAMTTDRSYRKARSAPAALEELRRCAGTQFDPTVVDAVVGVVKRGREHELSAAALLPDPAAALERLPARA
jgi:putative nucleotidyltransferase with HDIG domain